MVNVVLSQQYLAPRNIFELHRAPGKGDLLVVIGKSGKRKPWEIIYDQNLDIVEEFI